jgi:hypothetical protein
MKYPKKYLTTNPNIMKREIKKHGHKADDDSSAYGPWDADYKSGKAGKGKPVPTKTSKYTKKYKEMFGESEDFEIDNIVSFNDYSEPQNVFEEIVLEDESITADVLEEASKMGKNSPVYKALKKKSDKTGFPLGILRQVWGRGYAAWKVGHIPGTTPQQWAMARVNSFLTGGKTTKMGDKALYKRAKANRKDKN